MFVHIRMRASTPRTAAMVLPNICPHLIRI
jgi:hypothetical protein